MNTNSVGDVVPIRRLKFKRSKGDKHAANEIASASQKVNRKQSFSTSFESEKENQHQGGEKGLSTRSIAKAATYSSSSTAAARKGSNGNGTRAPLSVLSRSNSSSNTLSSNSPKQSSTRKTKSFFSSSSSFKTCRSAESGEVTKPFRPVATKGTAQSKAAEEKQEEERVSRAGVVSSVASAPSKENEEATTSHEEEESTRSLLVSEGSSELSFDLNSFDVSKMEESLLAGSDDMQELIPLSSPYDQKGAQMLIGELEQECNFLRSSLEVEEDEKEKKREQELRTSATSPIASLLSLSQGQSMEIAEQAAVNLEEGLKSQLSHAACTRDGVMLMLCLALIHNSGVSARCHIAEAENRILREQAADLADSLEEAGCAAKAQKGTIHQLEQRLQSVEEASPVAISQHESVVGELWHELAEVKTSAQSTITELKATQSDILLEQRERQRMVAAVKEEEEEAAAAAVVCAPSTGDEEIIVETSSWVDFCCQVNTIDNNLNPVFQPPPASPDRKYYTTESNKTSACSSPSSCSDSSDVEHNDTLVHATQGMLRMRRQNDKLKGIIDTVTRKAGKNKETLIKKNSALIEQIEKQAAENFELVYKHRACLQKLSAVLEELESTKAKLCSKSSSPSDSTNTNTFLVELQELKRKLDQSQKYTEVAEARAEEFSRQCLSLQAQVNDLNEKNGSAKDLTSMQESYEKRFLSFVEDLNRTLQKSQKDMHDVQLKAQEFSEQCQFLKGQVDRLEKERDEMHSQASYQSGHEKDLLNVVEELNTSLHKCQQDKAAGEEKAREVSEQCQNLQEHEQELLLEIQELKLQLQCSKEDMHAIDQKAQDFATLCEDLKSQIGALQGESQEATSLNLELQTRQEENQCTLSDLTDKCEKLTFRNEELKEENKQLHELTEQLQQENIQAQELNLQLECVQDEEKNNANELAVQCQKLTLRVNELKEENTQLHGLKAKLQDHIRSIESHQSQEEKLSEECLKLKEEVESNLAVSKSREEELLSALETMESELLESSNEREANEEKASTLMLESNELRKELEQVQNERDDLLSTSADLGSQLGAVSEKLEDKLHLVARVEDLQNSNVLLVNEQEQLFATICELEKELQDAKSGNTASNQRANKEVQTIADAATESAEQAKEEASDSSSLKVEASQLRDCFMCVDARTGLLLTEFDQVINKIASGAYGNQDQTEGGGDEQGSLLKQMSSIQGSLAKLRDQVKLFMNGEEILINESEFQNSFSKFQDQLDRITAENASLWKTLDKQFETGSGWLQCSMADKKNVEHLQSDRTKMLEEISTLLRANSMLTSQLGQAEVTVKRLQKAVSRLSTENASLCSQLVPTISNTLSTTVEGPTEEYFEQQHESRFEGADAENRDADHRLVVLNPLHKQKKRLSNDRANLIAGNIQSKLDRVESNLLKELEPNKVNQSVQEAAPVMFLDSSSSDCLDGADSDEFSGLEEDENGNLADQLCTPEANRNHNHDSSDNSEDALPSTGDRRLMKVMKKAHYTRAEREERVSRYENQLEEIMKQLKQAAQASKSNTKTNAKERRGKTTKSRKAHSKKAPKSKRATSNSTKKKPAVSSKQYLPSSSNNKSNLSIWK